jgi:hypothetical protein
MSLPGAAMPDLVRLTFMPAETKQVNGHFTPRERRLYIALAVILSLNLSVVCAALTFFGLLFAP